MPLLMIMSCGLSLPTSHPGLCKWAMTFMSKGQKFHLPSWVGKEVGKSWWRRKIIIKIYCMKNVNKKFHPLIMLGPPFSEHVSRVSRGVGSCTWRPSVSSLFLTSNHLAPHRKLPCFFSSWVTLNPDLGEAHLRLLRIDSFMNKPGLVLEPWLGSGVLS